MVFGIRLCASTLRDQFFELILVVLVSKGLGEVVNDYRDGTIFGGVFCSTWSSVSCGGNIIEGLEFGLV